jgi:hypothetical protein
MPSFVNPAADGSPAKCFLLLEEALNWTSVRAARARRRGHPRGSY